MGIEIEYPRILYFVTPAVKFDYGFTNPDRRVL